MDNSNKRLDHSGMNYSEEDQAHPISLLAMTGAEFLYDFFREGKMQDDRSFIMGVALTLSQYEDRVIRRITSPLKGIPSTSRFLPSIAEVREACDAARELFSRPVGRFTELAEKTLRERHEYEAEHPGARAERLRYERGEVSEYLRNGGAMPGPGQHMGKFESPPPKTQGADQNLANLEDCAAELRKQADPQKPRLTGQMTKAEAEAKLEAAILAAKEPLSPKLAADIKRLMAMPSMRTPDNGERG